MQMEPVLTTEVVLRNDTQMGFEPEPNETLFLDPFTIPDTYNFSEFDFMTEQDCEDLFLTVVGMYNEDKVKIDNAAERFLQRARVIQSSAAFHGLMEQAARIEAHIHQMCGEHQAVQDANSRLVQYGHSENDGHGHKTQNEEEQQHIRNCASEKGGRCDCK